MFLHVLNGEDMLAPQGVGLVQAIRLEYVHDLRVHLSQLCLEGFPVLALARILGSLSAASLRATGITFQVTRATRQTIAHLRQQRQIIAFVFVHPVNPLLARPMLWEGIINDACGRQALKWCRENEKALRERVQRGDEGCGVGRQAV